MCAFMCVCVYLLTSKKLLAMSWWTDHNLKSLWSTELREHSVSVTGIHECPLFPLVTTGVAKICCLLPLVRISRLNTDFLLGIWSWSPQLPWGYFGRLWTLWGIESGMQETAHQGWVGWGSYSWLHPEGVSLSWWSLFCHSLLATIPRAWASDVT